MWHAHYDSNGVIFILDHFLWLELEHGIRPWPPCRLCTCIWKEDHVLFISQRFSNEHEHLPTEQRWASSCSCARGVPDRNLRLYAGVRPCLRTVLPGEIMPQKVELSANQGGRCTEGLDPPQAADSVESVLQELLSARILTQFSLALLLTQFFAWRALGNGGSYCSCQEKSLIWKHQSIFLSFELGQMHSM